MNSGQAISPTCSSLIDKLAAMAAERRPNDTAFADFIKAYLVELPDFDLDDRRSDVLYAAMAYHYRMGVQRLPGESAVEVRTPIAERDGWDADHSYVFIVTDDRPFLVDTVRIVLQRHGVNTHLLIHPMLTLTRDDSGGLTKVEIGRDADQPGEVLEAWTQVEIDRLHPDAARALVVDLQDAVASVHRIVGDYTAMKSRLTSIAAADPLLDWLVDDHFVFIGAATYRLDGAVPETIDGTALGILTDDSAVDPAIDPDGPTVTVARTSTKSTIYRSARMTAFTIAIDETDDRAEDASENGVKETDVQQNRVRYERFVGLLSPAAYRRSVLSIPTVGDRARTVLGLAAQGAQTHAGRSMRSVLETLPRDLVFELDAHRLAELVIDVVGLQERQLVRIFSVPEPVGTATTVLVYLPKNRFTPELPDAVASIIGEAYGTSVDGIDYHIDHSSLALVNFTVADRGSGNGPDLEKMAERVDQLTTSWNDRIIAAAARRNGSALVTPAMVQRVGAAAPAEFRAAVPPNVAIVDLERVGVLVDGGGPTLTALSQEIDAPVHEWRIRVYRAGEPFSLSQLLPILSHLGLDALEEHPYEFVIDGDTYYLLDIGVRLPDGTVIDDDRHDELLAALDALLAGTVEADGFNQLVLRAGLTTRQTEILRAYARYAHQTNFTFSQLYVEESLARWPELTRGLIEHFEAKFDPDRPDGDDRKAAVQHARRAIFDGLEHVRSLDHDRIVRTFLQLIDATVRTSAFQVDKPTLAFKLNPSMTPDLPDPRPAHEIFVTSPAVEGVHLRGGPIARGGLRWSDRFEDYRTEVLGLVKAQMVKNAVIVPVGAKGGFIAKKVTDEMSGEERTATGIAAYRMYISALLDITDNIVDGNVVYPSRVVRYDQADPYLVVAADKGTAEFSDIANEVAAEYDFWLDDAFASGGSAGYDHKEMGITARGAWESVRRHCQHIGLDPEVDPITVVGIGDMSGDVFGNGMLRSATMKIVAAFDHRDIFIDPNPDPAAAFAERERLYGLENSTWQKYATELISAGGGVYPRTLKSIEITAEMRAVLGIADEVSELTPNELISAILLAPVDLLWNGGIGTYVKSESESHAQVGDRANDSLRVNGGDLRCKIVGEGGNLGFTQLGRIDYAVSGGLIYTDAIDNSAGVDTSDHEVNIKILLRGVIQAGEMTVKQRNELLESMTDEVAELVLATNKAQTLALMIARTQSREMVNVHARYLDVLEATGQLNRNLEALPTDKKLAERQTNGWGLRTPEFAVLIAYTKNVNIAEIMQSDLPGSAALDNDVIAYFPTALQATYRDEILNHRLRNEIAATQLVNQMTNLSGISYDHRMTEDTGSSFSDVARSWLVAREILDFPAWWAEIDALQGTLQLGDYLQLFLDCRRTAERCSRWFMRNRRPPVDIAAEAERFRVPLQTLQDGLLETLTGSMEDAVKELEESWKVKGVPADLARRAAIWRLLHTAFDIIEAAEANEADPLVASSIYWEVFHRLDLMWLWDGIGELPRTDRWQTQARAALRDDLMIALAGLAGSVLEHESGSVDGWIESNSRSYGRSRNMLTDIRRADSFNITNLSVALRQLRNLAATAVR